MKLGSKRFTVLFQNSALINLQTAIHYYNLQQTGLGKRFALSIRKQPKC